MKTDTFNNTEKLNCITLPTSAEMKKERLRKIRGALLTMTLITCSYTAIIYLFVNNITR